MEFLNTLMFFVVGTYILSIAIYHLMTKKNFNVSKNAIDSVIQVLWKYLKNLFSKKEEDSQYVPDAVLIQKLMTCLAAYSELPMAYTEWVQCTYSSLTLPAIKIQLICKTEESFPIIRNILINVFNQHLAENGLYSTYSQIAFHKYAENCYCMILVYAISDIEKENFRRLIKIRKYQAEAIAKKSAQADIDKELESDLKENGGGFEE